MRRDYDIQENGETAKLDLSAVVPMDAVTLMTPEERASLSMTVGILSASARFRSDVVRTGLMARPLRSVFEVDFILGLVGIRWFSGNPITLKEVATHFAGLITEVTVKRYIDDLQAAGMLVRIVDENDRRRLHLAPTLRTLEVSRRCIAMRNAIARQWGFVFDPERAAAEPAQAAE